MRRLFTTAALLFGLMASPAMAYDLVLLEDQVRGVSGGTVRFQLLSRDGRFLLFADNAFGGPVSVQVWFEGLQNLVLDEGRAVAVRTVPPGRSLLATLHRPDVTSTWGGGFRYRWFFGSRDTVPDEGYSYGLPFPSGRTFTITQAPFGPNSHDPGSGDEACVDWGFPEGSPVLASREGSVLALHDGSDRGSHDPAMRAFDKANWIAIRHDDGTVGCYWHLVKGGVRVQVGQAVRRGQVIGYSGASGYASGPHLHFGVYSPSANRVYQSVPFRYEGLSILRRGEQVTAP